MSLQPILTFLLSALFTITINAATPSQVAQGKILGYLDSATGNPPTHSDYLTTTFCYCALNDGHVPDRVEEAHYFQFAYYNVHSNTTFILQDACETSLDGPHTCLEDRSLENSESVREYQGVNVCRSWLKEPDNVHAGSDRFCYHVVDVVSKSWERMSFNGQNRRLGFSGGQGPLMQPAKVVREVCEDVCSANAGLHYVDDSQLAPNSVTVFEDLDDMCEGCRKKAD